MAMSVFTALLVVLGTLLSKVFYNIISCYWLTPRRIKKIMEIQGVSGPKPRFLVGNIPDVSALVSKSTAADMDSINHDIVGRLFPHYVAWSKKYGKRFIYWNGSEPRMCLTESEFIKELLTKYSTVTGKSWQQRQGAKHFVGRGLLMANGEDWHQQRHLLAPAFMGDKLKGYVGYMVECTNQMLQSLQNAVESGQTEFEITEYMTHLTADIISRTEFDSSYEKGKQIFHLLTVLQNLSAQASKHLYLPGSRFFPSKYNREIKAVKTEVERLLMEIIQSRMESVKIGESSSYGNDLLGMMLNEMEKKKKKRDESGGYFSIDTQLIMDECKTFFFAGHETTALMLTWTAMLLASNPTWQYKIRAQVADVCNGQTPTLDHLPKLTVLNMVINESMRLYPSAIIMPRMAFEDIKLKDLQIPKGLSIWIPTVVTNHNEELWGKDANDFNPDRFAGKMFAPGRHFIPFAAGPRNCVGQSFAMMEAKIILAMLVSRFSFTISPNYRHAPVIVITLKPKYGVQICLKPLKP